MFNKLHVWMINIINLDEMYVSLMKMKFYPKQKDFFPVDKEKLEAAAKYFENTSMLNCIIHNY